MDVIHENVFLGEMLLTHICTQILKIKILTVVQIPIYSAISFHPSQIVHAYISCVIIENNSNVQPTDILM